jgi:hypothetical protein
MIFINSHAIDNNRMYVLKLCLLNFLFNGFKIIIPLFFLDYLIYQTGTIIVSLQKQMV